MTPDLRPLAPSDRTAWETLWRGYQDFYGVDLPQATTERTWSRLLAPDEPVFGIVATVDSVVMGFTHGIFHRSTWLETDTCYLQDLFVEPSVRGRGLARALIDAVYRHADAHGAGQVYWLTHEKNSTARQLYDQMAHFSGFIAYERFVETPLPPEGGQT